MASSEQLAALKAAVLGAGKISAPKSPLGADSAPQLAALYQSSFQLPQSSGATSAAASISSDIAQAQRAAAARAQALAKQKAADLKNPNKYRAIKKQDGGYDFFDPEGNQVDIATLTERTGTRASDWLKDSENPVDIQYIQDYNNLQNLLQASVSKDKATIDKFKESFKLSGLPDVTEEKPEDIINQFKKYYQRYYVPQAWGVAPSRNPFVPAPQSGSSSYGLGSSTEGGI